MRNGCICYTTSTLPAKLVLEDNIKKREVCFFKNQAFPLKLKTRQAEVLEVHILKEFNRWHRDV